MKLLVGIRIEQFAGIPEDLGEQSPHAYVAPDAADATEMARQAQVEERVGWDPNAETTAEHGQRDVAGER